MARSSLHHAVEVAVSGELRRNVGWRMSQNQVKLAIGELLNERHSIDPVRTLLMNHEARVQAKLFIERRHLEER